MFRSSRFATVLGPLLIVTLLNAQYFEDHPVFGSESLYVDGDGVSWLRFSHSQAWSWSDIQAELDAGGMLEDFRHATETEFVNLVSQFGIMCNENTKENYSRAVAFMDVFGAAGSLGWEDEGEPYAYWYYCATSAGGFLDSGRVGKVQGIIEIIDRFGDGNSEYFCSGSWTIQAPAWMEVLPELPIPHFLVFDPEAVNPIPEPPLIGIASVLGLIVIVRRRQRLSGGSV